MKTTCGLCNQEYNFKGIGVCNECNINPYGRFKGIAHYKDADTGLSLCGGKIDPKQSNYWNGNSNYCPKCEEIAEGWLKA